MAPRRYPVPSPKSWNEFVPKIHPSHDPRAHENDRKDFGDKIITLVVGSEETKIAVHENLLCQHSPFFKAAVKKEWKGHQNAIPLPDDPPDVVSLYTQWIYQTRIFSRRSGEEPGRTHSEISRLVDAYAFGDKIQDERFADALIDAIIKSANTPEIEKSTAVPNANAIKTAFAVTVTGSPLRRLMVDIWGRHAQSAWITEGMPPDFLIGLARNLLDIRPEMTDQHPADGKASTCSYHHHANQEQCYNLNSEEIHLLTLL